MWFKQALGVAMALAGSALMSSCCCQQNTIYQSSDPKICMHSGGEFLFALGARGLDLSTCVSEAGAAVGPLQCMAVGGAPAMSALERQPDGSFTQWQYLASAPNSLVGSTPNYQTAFFTAPGAVARTFKNLPGWKFLADRQGVSTQSLVFANLLGNGTPVALALVPAGFDGGPKAVSLMVQAFNPDGSAKSPIFYAVPASPVGILVADFNHDGKDDVVVVGTNSNTPNGWTGNSIGVYLGNGDGTLKAPGFVSGNQGTYGATAYDFNGDGNLDLAVVNISSGDVSILLGKGDGTFASAVNYPAVSGAFLIAAGDFNGDGKADLAVGSKTSVSVLLGKGDGSFNASVATQAAFNSISALAAGDFNNDHKLDLAVGDSTSGRLSILLGDGTGKFPAEYDYAAGYGLATPNEAGNLFAMDLDGDGTLDVVVASGHPDVLTPTPYASDAIMAFFGRGDGTLIGTPQYQVGTGLNTVAVADFNGDGKPDIAAASGSLWILTASGGGAFKTPVSISLGSGVSANGLAAADLNGDGKPDLVVGDFNGSGVYVLLGNGDATFQTPVRYPVGGKVTSIAIADFNGDGKPDIAVSGASYNTGATVGILLGNGNGAFQSVANLSGATNPVSLAVGDFNNDGKPDLAIADQGTWPSDYSLPTDGGVLVYLGKGNGGFQSPVKYAAGLDPAFVVAADVNADHTPDLLVGTYDPNWNTNGQSDVAVLLGNGNGTFKAASYIATESGPVSIAVADWNGDGMPDLAIAHCCSRVFATYMAGNGDGTFQAENDVPGAYAPYTVAAADLNGDGKPDLIAGLAQYTKSAVAVFLNTSSSPPTVFLNPPLSAEGASVAASAGGGGVQVNAAAGSAWTAFSTAAWITITSGGSGAGSGAVTFTVAANSGAARSGTIDIGGQTFTIYQEGGSSALSFAGSMAHIASAGGWDTSLTLVNLGAAQGEARLNFYDRDGNAPQLPFTFPQQPSLGTTLGATFDQTLNANATLILDTTGPSQTLAVGSSQLLTNGSYRRLRHLHGHTERASGGGSSGDAQRGLLPAGVR